MPTFRLEYVIDFLCLSVEFTSHSLDTTDNMPSLIELLDPQRVAFLFIPLLMFDEFFLVVRQYPLVTP